MVSLKELSLRALCDALDCDAVLPPLAPQELTAIKNAANAFLRTLGLPESENPLASLRQIRRQALASLRELDLPAALTEGPFAHMLQVIREANDEANRNLVKVFNQIKLREGLPSLRGNTLEEQAENARNWIRENRETLNRSLFDYRGSFYNLGITALPPEITLPTGLDILSLGSNPLRVVPKDLPSALQTLCLDGTEITTVPTNLPPGLDWLDLSETPIKNLPEELPKGLRKLLISKTRIAVLPENLPPRLSILVFRQTPISEQFLAIPKTEWPESLRHLDVTSHFSFTLKTSQEVRIFHAFMRQRQAMTPVAGGAAAAAASRVDEDTGAGV